MKQEEFGVEERRAKILELLHRQGRVRVVDLAKQFDISDVTIRSDLTELENAGALERVHGGAVPTGKAYYNMPLQERMKANEDEKRRIARSVAGLVSPGDTLLVNSGTTTLFAVRELRGVRDLTIVTNSLPIAMEVGYAANVQVILLGGNFDPKYRFAFGDDALAQLARYRADKLILSVDGIAADEGLTTYHHLEAELSRRMIERAKVTIVAADHTKIGRVSFARIGSLECVDTLVTDDRASPDEAEKIRDQGVEVRWAT
jgi:DeoR family fructose operon transcriptional repressor